MTLGSRSVLEPVSETRPRFQGQSVRPWFCWALIASCVAIYLVDPPERPGSALMPGLWERLLLHGPEVSLGEYYRVLSSSLVHGGLLHLVLNMSVVVSLGFGLERVIGTARMAVVSLVGAVGAGAMTLLLSYGAHTVGASGMILAWAGVMLPILNRQGRRSIGVWLAQIAVLSLIPGISWQGHLGGFLFGLPSGFALKLGKGRFWWAAPFVLLAAVALAAYALQLHREATLPRSPELSHHVLKPEEGSGIPRRGQRDLLHRDPFELGHLPGRLQHE